MQTNQVVAKLKTDNPLKVGFQTSSQGLLVLDGFTHMVNGTNTSVPYLTERGEPGLLYIEGSRSFDLDDPIQKHNWNVLAIDLMLHPELAEQLELVDPHKASADKLTATLKRKELVDLILEHRDDAEWLAKVYRRTIGLASGLTTSTLLGAVLDKAETDYKAFWVGGKWFFAGEYFETESLLDLACERGVLIRDGDYFKKGDGVVFADSRQKAIYQLANDSAFRYYVQTSLTTPATDAEPDAQLQPESSELVELLEAVGQPVANQTPLRGDGSIDTDLEAARRDAELEGLVDQLIAGNFISASAGRFVLTDQKQEFTSKEQVIGYLKANPLVADELRDYVNLL